MEEIKIFNSPQFGEIRTAGTSEQPMFCLADVCHSLGLSAKGVNQRLGDEVISNYPIIDNLGRIQQALFVNEDGLYDVILDSRKPQAKAFRKWVTSEVLPAIRKTGGYIATTQDDTPEEIMARALTIAQHTLAKREERLKQLEADNAHKQATIELQEQEIKAAAPKVKVFDDYISSDGTSTTTQIAKEYGWGAETLNKKLREMGVQYKQNGQWILYAKYDGKGYTQSKPVTFTRSDGRTCTQMQTRWTARGRELIHSLIPLRNAANTPNMFNA